MPKYWVENYMPERGDITEIVSTVLPAKTKLLISIIQIECVYTFWWHLDDVWLVLFIFFSMFAKRKKKINCKTTSNNKGVRAFVFMFKRLTNKN